jgi:predicted acetyltransferase
MNFVHAAAQPGQIDARVFLTVTDRDEHDILIVKEFTADSPAAMLSILYFLATLRDQYHSAEITLPADFPLDRVLRQTQLPHRRVAHPFATARPFTRMQLRVLNHSRLLESMYLPRHPAFQAVIAVAESEGTLTRLHLQYDSGRLSVAHTTADPQFTCPDTAWSAIVTGDLPARTAVQLGLATTSDISIARNLDIFADGPAPFCNEYF